MKNTIPALFAASLLLAGISLANTDKVIFEGDPESEMILPGDDSADDITLYFGDSLSHFLRWDADRSIFVFSDNVDFGGNQLLDMRIENLATAPLCDSDSPGRLYYNTTENFSYVCNGTVWKQVDEESVSPVTPYLTTVSPAEINAGEVTTLTIIGGGFSPDTSVSIPGMTGTVGSVTVVSPSEVTVDITADAINDGTFDILIQSNGISNLSWNNNGVGALQITSEIILIPDVDEVIWERELDVVTDEGYFVPATTSATWNRGASFGTVPADEDFVLYFDPVYMPGATTGGYAMIGVDSSDPDHNYASIDYAFFIINGTQLYVYENGTSRGSVGTISMGDTLSITRENDEIQYVVSGSVVYTSDVPSTGEIVFDSSLYQYIGAENIELVY